MADPDSVKSGRRRADKAKEAGSISVLAHERKMRQVRALAGRLVLVCEGLGGRLGQELHDTVGQSLTLLAMSMGRLRKLPPDRAGPELDTAEALVRELVQQVRDISRSLGMYMLKDLGLPEALQGYFQSVQACCGVRTDFRHRGLERRLSGELEVMLLRIIQEAVANVCRHARTDRLDVSLDIAGGVVALRIEDKGVGFDPAAVGPGAAGMRGMRDRAALLDGRLAIESSPGRGTIITAEIPVKWA